MKPLNPKQRHLHSSIRNNLHYDPVSGDLTWLNDRNGAVVAGQKAGYIDFKGRYRVNYRHPGAQKSKPISALRVIWYLWFGEDRNDVRPRNGNPRDTRLVNLTVTPYLPKDA